MGRGALVVLAMVLVGGRARAQEDEWHVARATAGLAGAVGGAGGEGFASLGGIAGGYLLAAGGHPLETAHAELRGLLLTGTGRRTGGSPAHVRLLGGAGFGFHRGCEGLGLAVEDLELTGAGGRPAVRVMAGLPVLVPLGLPAGGLLLSVTFGGRWIESTSGTAFQTRAHWIGPRLDADLSYLYSDTGEHRVLLQATWRRLLTRWDAAGVLAIARRTPSLPLAPAGWETELMLWYGWGGGK